ncbi:MAG: flagellar basal-body rod protein FlgG [Planctomycetota bacterium]
MAVEALHSAASGMTALSTQIDVIANNIANVNTTGFKASRANFEDLLYQQREQPGVENGDGPQNPALLQVGLGVRVSNTQFDFGQGSIEVTNRSLDLAVEGDGLFRVTVAGDRTIDNVGYTRAGNFFVNRDNQVVLGNSEGAILDPPIEIPDDAVGISISPDGIFTAIDSQQNTTELGQIQLATFVNPSGLKSIGGNIFVETEVSGPPVVGNPLEGQLGGIAQGQLEASNADPVTELVSLIKAQRAFELNSQTIQAADETLSVVSNLRRF